MILATYQKDFYDKLITKGALAPTFVIHGDPAVSIQARSTQTADYQFVMNFSEENKQVVVANPCVDLLTNQTVDSRINLNPYEVKILKIQK